MLEVNRPRGWEEHRDRLASPFERGIGSVANRKHLAIGVEHEGALDLKRNDRALPLHGNVPTLQSVCVWRESFLLATHHPQGWCMVNDSPLLYHPQLLAYPSGLLC